MKENVKNFPPTALKNEMFESFQEIYPVGKLNTQIGIPGRAEPHSDVWELHTYVHNM